jgi:hypothetical protein
MADTEYAAAWAEEDSPAENAVMAAAKKVSATEKAEYITAYADLEDGKSKKAEDVKDAKAKKDEEKSA